MRCFALARVVLLSVSASCMLVDPPASSAVVSRVSAPNLDLARDLDHEGVRAYSSGRYQDAAMLFREARRLGGPAIELWNEARCLERTNDLERAARVLEDFLAQPDLAPEDHAGADRELALIRAKPSVLTVSTIPPGAAVMIDGQIAGLSPASIDVPPGPHAVTLRRMGFREETQRLEARFGRALVVEIELVKQP
jgi:hypothetical protein